MTHTARRRPRGSRGLSLFETLLALTVGAVASAALVVAISDNSRLLVARVAGERLGVVAEAAERWASANYGRALEIARNSGRLDGLGGSANGAATDELRRAGVLTGPTGGRDALGMRYSVHLEEVAGGRGVQVLVAASGARDLPVDERIEAARVGGGGFVRPPGSPAVCGFDGNVPSGASLFCSTKGPSFTVGSGGSRYRTAPDDMRYGSVFIVRDPDQPESGDDTFVLRTARPAAASSGGRTADGPNTLGSDLAFDGEGSDHAVIDEVGDGILRGMSFPETDGGGEVLQPARLSSAIYEARIVKPQASIDKPACPSDPEAPGTGGDGRTMRPAIHTIPVAVSDVKTHNGDKQGFPLRFFRSFAVDNGDSWEVRLEVVTRDDDTQATAGNGVDVVSKLVGSQNTKGGWGAILVLLRCA